MYKYFNTKLYFLKENVLHKFYNMIYSDESQDSKENTVN